MYHQMVMNALSSPPDTLTGANQQALAYSRSLQPAS
jgi:hypothetical protein